MKTSSLILIAAFVLFQSVGAHAAGIYQMGYRYSFDGMARDGARRQTFVICEDACAAAPPLAPAPRFPALSIRVSQDVASQEKPQKRLRMAEAERRLQVRMRATGSMPRTRASPSSSASTALP